MPLCNLLDQQLHDQLEQLVSASLTTRGLAIQSILWQREQVLKASEERLASAMAELHDYEQASTSLDALDDEQRQLEQTRKPQLEQEQHQLMEEQRQVAQAKAARQSLEQQLTPLNQRRQQLQLQRRRLQETEKRWRTNSSRTCASPQNWSACNACWWSKAKP